ncbi:MAG: HAMP domain-containing protein, partial [Caryophanon sp.]|nr:HAMP domain-containing protein [Caryophanon sp.]
MKFKSLKVRILSGFSLLITVFILFTVYNYTINNSIAQQTNVLVEQDLAVLNSSESMVTSSSVRLSAALGYILTGDTTYIDSFNYYKEEANKHAAILQSHTDNQELADLIESGRAWTKLVEDDVFAVYQAGDVELARDNLLGATDLVTSVLRGYSETADYYTQSMETAGADVAQNTTSSKTITVIVSIFVILLGSWIAIATANTIARPINEVAERMKGLATGDLSSEPLHVKEKDEIGSLMISANDLNARLKSTIHSITDAAETVSKSSAELVFVSTEVKENTTQVTSTMEELADGTEKQASAAADLTESMQTFTHSIELTTKESLQLQHSSQSVQQLTLSGRSLMEQSTDQMTTINRLMLDSVH